MLHVSNDAGVKTIIAEFEDNNTHIRDTTCSLLMRAIYLKQHCAWIAGLSCILMNYVYVW